MSNRRLHLLCLSLIGLGVLGSIVVGAQRWRIEAANRTVELVVDYGEAVMLAGQKGVTTRQCLGTLKGAGATSVAVQEATLESLVRDGVLTAAPSSRWGETSLSYEGGSALVASPVAYLQAKVQAVRWKSDRTSGTGEIIMRSPPEDVWRTGLGVPPEALAEVTVAGLFPVGRPANDALVSQRYLQRLFSDLSKAGVTKVIFDGKSVLGFPGLLQEVARGLSDQGLSYCWVEFAEQLGDAKLAKFAQYHLLRLHSISPEEMVRLKPEEALDRLIRAVKERNIRVLYVRLPLSASPLPQAQPLDFLKNLAQGLKDSGFRLGKAEVLPDYSPRFVWLLLVVLGICASPFLLLNYWGVGRPRLLAALLAFAVVMGLGLVLGVGGLGRPLLALLAAVVFPTIGIAFLLPGNGSSTGPVQQEDGSAFTLGGLQPCPSSGRPEGLRYMSTELTPVRPPVRALRDAVLRVSACVGISLVGGLFVAAVLSKTSYFVGIELFRGIKLAEALPLVVVFVLLVGGVGSEGRKVPSEEKIRGFLGLGLEVKHVLALLFLLLVAAVWIMRTGNQPGVGVLPLEMKVRGILESALGARPRTKEFLLGHPLLLLGFMLYALPAASAWRRWAPALVLIGAIGQASVVNTFCHLHSPLYLGLWRTFNGLWLGCLIGVILALLIFGRRRWPAELPRGREGT